MFGRSKVVRSEADSVARGRAAQALTGLAVGDAFGERFFGRPEYVVPAIQRRVLPAAPWWWTDDTAMALSIYEELAERGGIDRDALATRFARRYMREPARGYGATAHTILRDIALGRDWRTVAREAFDGQGSMGNGAAMRAAPLGAFFAEDTQRVIREARASAEPTHLHEEGIAGAIAVAIAAAASWRTRGQSPSLRASTIFDEVLNALPASRTRDGVERAASLSLDSQVGEAVEQLGNGAGVIASDTVPFAVWCAVRHVDDFVEAMWATVAGLGDRDTTCAIVGGIIAAGGSDPPEEWINAAEPLDLE